MNTNAIPIIQQAAQHVGLNISGYELGVILAAGSAATRWLHLEIPVWIAAYAKAGGWRGILRFLNTGSTQAAAQPAKL